MNSLADGTISVSDGNDSGVFYHEDHSTLRSTRAMEHALGNDSALPRTKLHGAAFEVNQQLPFDNVEKLIIIVMLVPVIFALYHTKTDDRAIHLTESLVVPLVGARFGERALVDDFQGLTKDVESGFVRKAFHIGHWVLRMP